MIPHVLSFKSDLPLSDRFDELSLDEVSYFKNRPIVNIVKNKVILRFLFLVFKAILFKKDLTQLTISFDLIVIKTYKTLGVRNKELRLGKTFMYAVFQSIHSLFYIFQNIFPITLLIISLTLFYLFICFHAKLCPLCNYMRY